MEMCDARSLKATAMLHVPHICNRWCSSQLRCQNSKCLFFRDFHSKRGSKTRQVLQVPSRTVDLRSLTRQRIFNPRWRRFHQPPEFWFEFCHFFLHFPRDAAITEVPLYSRTKPRNIFRLREIHLEKKPGFGGKWQQIMRCRLWQAACHVTGK